MWCGDHTVNLSTKNAAEFATRRLTPPEDCKGGGFGCGAMTTP